MRYQVRDEYKQHFGRQVLTLWEGGFASSYFGEAVELPGHDGYMITSQWGEKLRVKCPSPRGNDNWREVDAALSGHVEAWSNQ